MSRHPVGDQAMTTAERQRGYIARLKTAAAAAVSGATAAGLVVRLDHLRLYPDRVAP
jgi:hypothetical protein